MGSIFDIHNPWRDALMPASFRGAMFHVEVGSRDNGRRIVVHEFPKKNDPYAEDMGKRAIEFTVRGYCIAYPVDPPDAYLNTNKTLYQRDYRQPRNALLEQLEKEGDGVLQLPTLLPVHVVVTRYRLTEEEKLGGYCVFDMTFVESGIPPSRPIIASRDDLLAKASVLSAAVQAQLGPPPG